MTHADTLNLTPSALAKILVGLLLTLLSLHIIALILYHGLGYEYAMGYVPLTHMDMESNIPTMTSFSLMVMCAAACGLMSWNSGENKRHGRAWALIAVLFLFLAADESMMIHEKLVTPATKDALGSSAPEFAWIVPYALGVAVIGIFLLRWFFELRRPLQISLAIAGILFLTGALGIELIASRYWETLPEAMRGGRTLLSDEFATAEETLELSGLAYFLFTLVKELGGISIRTPRLAEHAGTRQ